MDALSATEINIIRSMLVKTCGERSGFLDQLAAVRVERRKLTGGGVFLYLAVPSDIPASYPTHLEISVGCRTALPIPADLVGFTLFIRDGYLNLLEGYTFGNVQWPDELIEKHLLLDTLEMAA